jgi:acetyltransferase-like isoleucine patch superfamily enzyme
MLSRQLKSFCWLLWNWSAMIVFWVKLRWRGAAVEFPFRGNGLTLLDSLDSERIRIGRGVRILSRAHLAVIEGGQLSIGEGTSIGSDLVLACAKQIRIGAKVLIAARCFISDTSHVYEDVSLPIIDQGVAEGRAVEIQDGCWIGINVCIFPGVTVGRNAVVGANSVVTRDIPSLSIACGAPARVIRQYDLSTGRWVAPLGNTLAQSRGGQ